MNEKLHSLDETLARCRTRQRGGAKVVLTNGCFDLLHVGHIRYLRRAREMGDALVVALNGDDSVRALKGPGRPINAQAERAEVLAALECVDYVTVFHEPIADRVVEVLRPDIYVKGGDYAPCGTSSPEARIVAGYGGLVVFLDFEEGASTTGIIDRIVARGRQGLLGRSAARPSAAAAGGAP